MELQKGADLRLPENRMEIFQRFYTFHLKYRAHPGMVYALLPRMKAHFGWDAEQQYWAAWLNASTQNPITTLLLMEVAPVPRLWRTAVKYQQQNWHRLQWDTDRKYQKTLFPSACERYVELMNAAGSQAAYWQKVNSWTDAWQAMTALPTMGRLSAWSGLEYYRLLTSAPIPDADTLLLHDAHGSRSHRNGLALLAGQDHIVQDAQLNPGYSDKWSKETLEYLKDFSVQVLREAQHRNPGCPHVGYLTLESTLCVFKSTYKKNRRYPGVYADMCHNRIKWAEAHHGDKFGVLWDARRETLPSWLRLEDNPGDPGVKSVKQNWFRSHGQYPTIGHEWPELLCEFDELVKERKFGTFR
jgi:Amino acid:DNA transferase